MKHRVDHYFIDNGISRNFNSLMLFKTAFYISGFALLYGIFVAVSVSFPVRLLEWLIFGFFTATIGFNVGHDAVHGAYSNKPWINKLAGHAFELIGACSFTWNIRHNQMHHTYTNITGYDGDLESMPLLRFCLKPGRKGIHRFQHWYAPILYGFVTFVWVFRKDYKHMLEEKHHENPKRHPPASAYVSLVTFKLLHYLLFLLIPIFYLKLPVWQVVLGFMTMHFIAGVMLSFVFQLGHCVEGPEIIPPGPNHAIGDNWSEHQLKSSSNFGGGVITNWICGGLNFQIEHHLFPKVCHVHYPAIASIVSSTAQEYGLPYHQHTNFYTGVCSHLRMLKYYGSHDEATNEAYSSSLKDIHNWNKPQAC